MFHRELFDTPVELRDPTILAALIGAGGAVASTLGIGSGGQNVRPIGPPGNVDRVAGQFESQLKEVLQRQGARRDAPIVFPGNQQAFARASGSARIAGLPTGTIGRNPALGSFLRRRRVSLGTGEEVEPSPIFPEDPDRPVIPDPRGSSDPQNQVLLAIKAILEQNRSFA